MLNWQKAKNRIFFRIISLLVIQAFFISNIGYTAPSDRSLFKDKKVNYKVIQEQREKDLQKKRDVLSGQYKQKKSLYNSKDSTHRINISSLNDLSNIYIPEGFGRVVEVYQAPSDKGAAPGPFVVHIQDLHTNPEGQFNEASILDILVKDYGLSLVCSEGAEGEVDTSSVSSFPDPDVREKTARLFVNSGELTAEEYISITKYPDLPIWGIEDKDIYFQNIIEFNKIMKFSPASLALTNQIKEALEKLKPGIYSKKLLEIDKNEKRYEKSEIDTKDYIDYLIDIDSSYDARDEFKNISLFIQIQELEKGIDQGKIIRQSQELLSGLQAALSKNRGKEIADLTAKAGLFKDKKISPFSFYSYLDELARAHLRDDMDKYKDLFEFVDYLTKVNSLDSVRLFSEIEELTYALKDSFSTNQAQRLLTKSLRRIKILEDFFNLKLSNEELDYYLADREGHRAGFFEAFLKENLPKYNIEAFIDFNSELIDYRLEELEHFYDIAKKRDAAMCNNAMAEIQRRGAKVATIVTGGFHTRGITRFLKEKGCSYAVIAPYSSTEINEENYRALLSGKRKPISELIDALNDMLRPIMSMSSSKFKKEAVHLGLFPNESNDAKEPKLNPEDERIEKEKIKSMAEYLSIYFEKRSRKNTEVFDILKSTATLMQDLEDLYGREYRIKIALSSQETRELVNGLEMTFLFRRLKDNKEYRFYYRVISDVVEKLTAEEYQWQIADKMRDYYEKLYFPDNPSGNISITRKNISLNQCAFANDVSRWRTEFKKLRLRNNEVNPAIILKDPTRGGAYIIIEGCHRAMAKLEAGEEEVDPRIDAWVLEFRRRSRWLPVSFQNQIKAIPIGQVKVIDQIPPLFDLISEGILDRVTPQEQTGKLFSIIQPSAENIAEYISQLQQIVNIHKKDYIGATAQEMISKIRNASSGYSEINEEEWLAVLSTHGLQSPNIEHTKRNIDMIIYFAQKLGLTAKEQEILEAALWLHDITKDRPLEDYIPEDKSLASTFRLLIHHLEGMEAAEVILKEQGRNNDFIDQVKNIILRHMGPIKGTFIFKGKECGFMEHTRLENFKSIKKALRRSKIDKNRKNKLKMLLDKIEKGFPEPETRLEEIARDIDLLDLAADGVTKVVFFRQTDPKFFDKKTGKPETVEESFYSAIKSARDTESNLYTEIAKQKIDVLLKNLENFKGYMFGSEYFDLIEKTFPANPTERFLQEVCKARAEVFKRLYDSYNSNRRDEEIFSEVKKRLNDDILEKVRARHEETLKQSASQPEDPSKRRMFWKLPVYAFGFALMVKGVDMAVKKIGEPSSTEIKAQADIIEPIHEEPYSLMADFKREKKHLIDSRRAKNNLLNPEDTEKVKSVLTPGRINVIRLAADTWNLEPELIAGFLYEELTDTHSKNSIIALITRGRKVGPMNVHADWIRNRDFLDFIYTNQESLVSLIENARDVMAFKKFMKSYNEGPGKILRDKYSNAVWLDYLESYPLCDLIGPFIKIEAISILLGSYAMRAKALQIAKRNEKVQSIPETSVMKEHSGSWLVEDYKEIPNGLKDGYMGIFNSSYYPPYAYQYFLAADYTGVTNSIIGKKKSLAKVKAYIMFLRSAAFKSSREKVAPPSRDRDNLPVPQSILQAFAAGTALTTDNSPSNEELEAVQEAARDIVSQIRPMINSMAEEIAKTKEKINTMDEIKEYLKAVDDKSQAIMSILNYIKMSRTKEPSKWIKLMQKTILEKIRNPLSSIVSKAQLLISSEGDVEKIKKGIEQISNNIGLIEEVLYNFDNNIKELGVEPDIDGEMLKIPSSGSLRDRKGAKIISMTTRNHVTKYAKAVRLDGSEIPGQIKLTEKDEKILVNALNDLIETNPRLRAILKEFLKALKGYPLLEFCTFSRFVEGLFFFALPGHSLIAIHEDFTDNPAAVFRAVGEYLIRQGRLKFRFDENKIAVSIDNREIYTTVLSKDAFKFIQEEKWKEGWQEDHYYLLKALQDNIFGDLGVALADKVKNKQAEKRILISYIESSKLSDAGKELAKKIIEEDIEAEAVLALIIQLILKLKDINTFSNSEIQWLIHKKKGLGTLPGISMELAEELIPEFLLPEEGIHILTFIDTLNLANSNIRYAKEIGLEELNKLRGKEWKGVILSGLLAPYDKFSSIDEVIEFLKTPQGKDIGLKITRDKKSILIFPKVSYEMRKIRKDSADRLRRVQNAGRYVARKIRPEIEGIKSIVANIDLKDDGGSKNKALKNIIVKVLKIAKFVDIFFSRRMSSEEMKLLQITVAHEINNPLTSIMGYAGLLETKRINNEMDMINKMDKEIERIERILYYLDNIKRLIYGTEVQQLQLDLEACSREGEIYVDLIKHSYNQEDDHRAGILNNTLSIFGIIGYKWNKPEVVLNLFSGINPIINGCFINSDKIEEMNSLGSRFVGEDHLKPTFIHKLEDELRAGEYIRGVFLYNTWSYITDPRSISQGPFLAKEFHEISKEKCFKVHFNNIWNKILPEGRDFVFIEYLSAEKAEQSEEIVLKVESLIKKWEPKNIAMITRIRDKESGNIIGIAVRKKITIAPQVLKSLNSPAREANSNL